MWSKGRRYIAFILLICICATTVLSENTYRAEAAWFNAEDSFIYKEPETEDINKIDNLVDWLINAAGGLVDSILGTLLGQVFISLGDGINEILWQFGIGLDTIIFGRVNGAVPKNKIPLFTFGLEKGNVYGMVAMGVYSIISGLCILFIIMRLLYYMVAFIYTNGGAKAREDLQNIVAHVVISIVMTVLFAQILYICIYLRDLILYYVSEGIDNLYVTILQSWRTSGGNSLFDLADNIYSGVAENHADSITVFFSATSSNSIIANFRKEAVGLGLMNSIVYLGSILFTVYMAISYISLSLSMVLVTVFFPLCCLMEFKERGKIGYWFRVIISFLLTPIIDAVLLYIPIIMNAVRAPGLVILVLLFSIIPARNFVRKLLNLERPLDVAPVVTALGAMMLRKLARAAVTGYTKNGERIQEMHEAAVNLESIKAQKKDLGEASENLENEAVNIAGSEFMRPLNPETDLAGLSVQQAALAREDNVMGALNSVNNEIGETQKQIDANNAMSANLGSDIAEVDAERVQLMQRKSALLDADGKDNGADGLYKKQEIKKIDDALADNALRKSSLVKEQKSVLQKNADNKIRQQALMVKSQKLSELSNKIHNKNVTMGCHNLDNVRTNNATLENFETPAYRNISMERKAELYKLRAEGIRKETAMNGNEELHRQPNESYVDYARRYVRSRSDAYRAYMEQSGAPFAVVTSELDKTFEEKRKAGFYTKPDTSERNLKVGSEMFIPNENIRESDNKYYNAYRDDWKQFAQKYGDTKYRTLKQTALHAAENAARKEVAKNQEVYVGPPSGELSYYKDIADKAMSAAKQAYYNSVCDSMEKYSVFSRDTLDAMAERMDSYQLREEAGRYLAEEITNADEEALRRRLVCSGIIDWIS